MRNKNTLKDAVVASAIWAAYGDALGFPTELISAGDFLKRNGTAKILEPIGFKRRVGGLFGPEVSFPAGAYSDDTQLRLCTSRAIRGDGFFDVESFAKIELPVWLNYALGAGRGSKAAATSLALRDTTWSQNFFASGDVLYWNGGGNGAAMRIQPHVWKSHSDESHGFFADVVRDAICTHGHPRGIVGAAIHAQLLYLTLQSGSIPQPDDWIDIGQFAADMALSALTSDEELSLIWIPRWEQLAKRSLAECWKETENEWTAAASYASRVSALPAGSLEASYRDIVEELGGLTRSERGSGLKTPLYALASTWLAREEEPEVALQIAANLFGSDTDTVATMAGALVGAVHAKLPHAPVQDQQYIANEAVRVFDIGTAERSASFPYPNLLNWIAPKTQSDAWVVYESRNGLAGLGGLEANGEEYFSTKGTELIWQWCRLDFGQTILAKHKVVTKTQDMFSKQEELLPARQSAPMTSSKESSLRSKDSAPNLFDARRNYTIDEATDECIRSNFDATLVGSHLMAFCRGPNGIENAIAFAAIISKARLVRLKRG